MSEEFRMRLLGAVLRALAPVWEKRRYIQSRHTLAVAQIWAALDQKVHG